MKEDVVMSKTFYKANDEQVNLVENKDIQNLKFLEFSVYDEFGISNPVDAIKKIYTSLPNFDGYPIFVNLKCGAFYTAIVQKASDNYLSAIIFGYSTYKIIYLRKLQEQWYES